MKYLPLLLLLLSCRSGPTSPGKVATTHLTDTSFTFLWREMRYDAKHNDSFSTIIVDTIHGIRLPDPVKAAIAYIAYDVGSECIWDGRSNSDRSNLKCKVTTALGLNYQCSEKQRTLLDRWIMKDSNTHEYLRGCSTIPWGASNETTFDSITVRVHADSIIILSAVSGVNMPAGLFFEYHQLDIFLLQHDSLGLAYSDRFDLHKSHFSITSDDEE